MFLLLSILALSLNVLAIKPTVQVRDETFQAAMSPLGGLICSRAVWRFFSAPMCHSEIKLALPRPPRVSWYVSKGAG